MFPCTESGIVCGLCPCCAQTNCRRTVSVLCRPELKTARKFCRSSHVCVRSAYTLISFHIAHHVLFPHLFGTSSQSNDVIERRCSWNVCGIHTVYLTRGKKRPKYAKHLWTWRLFNDGVQEGNNLLRKLNTGLSKKMDGIWNRYNLKSTGRIYTFGVLRCSEKFKVLDLP